MTRVILTSLFQNGSTYHDGEYNANLRHDLEDTEHQEEGHLVQCVGVYTDIRDTTKVVVVWFVFVWDQW